VGVVEPLAERDNGIDTPSDPTDVDEDDYMEWLSSHHDAVVDVLTEMTGVYADDSTNRPIRNATVSHVTPDDDYVGVQLDLPAEMDPAVTGPNILRLLDDLTAHEMSHVNWSDLDAKREFAESYPGWGRLPGFVQNALEDEYIDTRRMQKWHGMRDKMAFYTWLHMNTESRSPPVDEVFADEGLEQALMNALLQTCLAGYVKGIEDAPDEIAECMARIEPIVERVRATHDPDKRTKLAHVVMQILARYLPDPSAVDDDELSDKSRDTSAMPDPPEAPESDTPEIDLPDELKDEIADALESMMESPDMPDPTDTDAESGGDGSDTIVTESDEFGSATENGESDESNDATGAGDSASNPEGSTGEDTDTPDSSGDESESGGDSSSDTGETRDIEALVEEYGADNLVVDE